MSNNSFTNCYNEAPEGYYLDNDEKIYKLYSFENNNSTGILNEEKTNTMNHNDIWIELSQYMTNFLKYFIYDKNNCYLEYTVLISISI